MKRRRMRGVPAQKVTFGECDPNPFAPLHRRMGISTFTHYQATTDYVGGFDRATGMVWSPHLYRVPVTLARV